MSKIHRSVMTAARLDLPFAMGSSIGSVSMFGVSFTVVMPIRC